MLIVDDKLISDDVVTEQFSCNLSACKGACCWEGDYGAPLTAAERDLLPQIYPLIRPYLSPLAQAAIEEEGLYAYEPKEDEYGTTCLPTGACVFMTRSKDGCASCAFELAHRDGLTNFQKPISCALYPIRVIENEDGAFTALNYDRWDICSAACSKGEAEKMPVYKFVRDAIVRKWGQEFYEQLDAAARHFNQQQPEADSKG